MLSDCLEMNAVPITATGEDDSVFPSGSIAPRRTSFSHERAVPLDRREDRIGLGGERRQ